MLKQLHCESTLSSHASNLMSSRLWKEHGYKNGRIVFVSCKSRFCDWPEEVADEM